MKRSLKRSKSLNKRSNKRSRSRSDKISDLSKYQSPYKHIDLWYGPKQKNTVAEPHKRIFKTRETGRTGNQLFEYVFWTLMTLEHGGIFENTYTNLPRPFDKLPKTFQIKKNETQDLGLKNYHELIPGYPMSFKYYANKRHLLQQLLNMETFTKKYDIVIHVRLDDVFGSIIDHPELKDYTVLPFSFYENVFKVIKKVHGPTKSLKILLLGRTVDSFQKKILEDLTDYIKKVSGSKNVLYKSGSVTEDLIDIMSSPILVGSTSSFWTIPTFLSNISEEIHIPVFGQTNMYHYFDFDSVVYKNYVRRYSERDNYTIYGYLLPFTEKIQKETIELMYDR